MWPIKVGDVIKIAEADYCYGLGWLVLRVSQVPAREAEWIELDGMQLRGDGTQIQQRTVTARTAGIIRVDWNSTGH